jgi:hypothetical protein
MTLGQPSYARGINVHIPNKCTRCSVRASKQFIGNRPVEWVRARCPCCKRPPERPRHMSNGMHCLAKKISLVPARSIILGDPILKLGSGSVSGVSLEVIRFLGSPDHLPRLTASFYNKAICICFSVARALDAFGRRVLPIRVFGLRPEDF